MENNTKKGLIAAGIIALLVWFSKKGKPIETPTEEPSGGGGGGGGGAFPMITPIPVPVPVPTPSSKPTTPSNLSPSLKSAGGVQSAPTSATKPVLINSGGFSNTGYNSATNTTTSTSMNESVKCLDGKIYSVSAADIKAAGGKEAWCRKNGHSQASGVGGNVVMFDGKIVRPSRKVDFF